jgi:CBS domain containing-hemolysin-like protein
MTPRVDLFAFNIEDDIKDLIEDHELFLYSRIPVYEESLDNIIGVLSIKVLLKEYLKGNKINVRKLMKEPMFVHKSKSISSLLEDFKKEHQHMAFIKDEFGGTMGIVTMEDIVEELVGDIWDESDKIEEDFIEKEEGVYIVDGSMNIEDFFDLVGYEEEYDTEYTTVSGFVTEILERFARVGDTFDFDKLTITVLEAEEFTVEKIKVEIDDEEEDED